MGRRRKVNIIDAPLITIDPADKSLSGILYSGNNSKEVMDFCEAYHMEIVNDSYGLKLKLWNEKHAKSPIIIKLGQSLFKENDHFIVRD